MSGAQRGYLAATGDPYTRDASGGTHDIMVDSATLAKLQEKAKSEVVKEDKPWYHHTKVQRYRYGGPLRVGLDIFVPLYWFRPLGNYKPVITMSSCVYLGGFRYYDNPQDVTRQTFFLYDWEETDQPFDYAMVLSDGELSNYFWQHEYGSLDKTRFGGKKFNGVVLNVKEYEITLACDDFVYDFPLSYFDHPVLPLQVVSFTISDYNQAIKGGKFDIRDMTIWDVAHEQLTQMPFLNNTAFNFAIAARNLLKNKANLKRIANVRKRNRINKRRKKDDNDNEKDEENDNDSKDEKIEITEDEQKKEKDQKTEMNEKEKDLKVDTKKDEKDLKVDTKKDEKDLKVDTKKEEKVQKSDTKKEEKVQKSDTKKEEKVQKPETKKEEKDQKSDTKEKKDQKTDKKEKGKGNDKKIETKEAKVNDQKSTTKDEVKGTDKVDTAEEEEITEQEKAIMMDVTKQLLEKLNIGYKEPEKPVEKEEDNSTEKVSEAKESPGKESAISATDTDPEAPKDKKKPPKPRRPRKPRDKKEPAKSKEEAPTSEDLSSSPKKTSPAKEEPLSIKELGEKKKSEGTEENNNSNSSDKNRTDESVDGSPKKKQQRRRPRRRRNPKEGNEQKTETVAKETQGENKPSQD